MLASKAAAKRLDLSVFVSPSCPADVRGDPGRLRQVLVNLIGNALKFTEMGHVALSVEPVEDGGRLRFEVRDTGIGIPKNVLPQLFQPFMQADSSTTRRFGGTGLGLAICKQIVETAGGRIGAYSEPGQGARFWFELEWPFVRESADTRVAELEGVGVVLLARSPGLRETLDRYFSSWGAKVATTASLDAAEAVLRGNDEIRHWIAETGSPLGFPVCDLHEVGRRFPRLRTAVASWPGAREIETARAANLEVLYRPLKRGRLIAWAAGQDARRAGEQQTRRPAGNLRVLVAEDNPVNQRIALKMLERLGHDATIAVNGKEALERARAEPFDLILMDCQMPEMDGFQAAREIRRGGASPPIVALTANALEGDRQRCLDAGMDDYLPKPIDLAGLAKTIELWRFPPGSQS
jgi:CheY-like chemotaxis protein